MNDLTALQEVMESNLASMTTVQLAEIYLTAKVFSSKIYQLKTHIEGLLIRELRFQNVEKVISNKTRTPITLGKTTDRKFDIEILKEELKPLLSEEQWSSAVKMEPKILWENLKDISKINAVAKEIIDKAVIEFPKPVLKIGVPSKVDRLLLSRHIIPIDTTQENREVVLSSLPPF
ncbi:MAG: hypothetical protein A2452_08990 [Candidatus Firestonebacteria bacterium RIFOXYC2_FULL_39_67]|nr:MAG: hypothetical protein A2536_09510 [Candidatus Firestonebacteria bacterium RIFOXYD2_FULL_39_29]OGF53585.1 MAG: hypothetical protein A2452_08990 [Candidatus Firestonebacteria bacterium RIFOXYC2_FULL_39_67]